MVLVPHSAKLLPAPYGARTRAAQTIDTMDPVDHADLMGIGDHCHHPDCGQRDFLPFGCQGCQGIFCGDHRSAEAHRCSAPPSGGAQVIVCPLCASAVRIVPGQDPNETWERHTVSA